LPQTKGAAGRAKKEGRKKAPGPGRVIKQCKREMENNENKKERDIKLEKCSKGCKVYVSINRVASREN
jgi:hypothetical protein